MSDKEDDTDVESSFDDSEDTQHRVETLIRSLSFLKEENTKLRNNFDNLKSLHIQLTSSHQELEGRYVSLQAERVHIERQYQHLCDSWRVELEDKQKQFDQVKAQILQPRDLELLRLQLLEEVEGPFKLKCEIITQEAEAAQQNFVKLRREHEALQSERDSMELRLKGELEAQRVEAEMEARMLKERTQQLTQCQGKLSQLEVKVRQLEREKGDADTLITHLREECEDLRVQKQKAVHEKDQALAKAERQRKELQAAELEAQSLLDTQCRKVRHLQKELSESSAAQEAMHTQLMSLQGQSAMLTRQVEEERRQHAAELAAVSGQLSGTEQRMRERVEELTTRVDEKDGELSQLASQHRKQLAQVEEEHREALREAEEKLAARSQQLGVEKAELAARLAALEAQIAADQEQHQRRKEERSAMTEELQSIMKGVAAAQQEASAARGQLEGAQQQCAKLQQEVVELKATNEALKRDMLRLESGQSPDMLRWRDMEVRMEGLEARNSELQAALEQRAQELRDAHKRAEKEQQEWAACMRTSKQAWAVEKSALVKRCNEQLKSIQEQHQGEAKRWRNRLKRAKHSIVSLQNEVSALRVQAVEAQELSQHTLNNMHMMHSSWASDPGFMRPSSAGFGALRPSSPLALAVSASPRVFSSALDRPPSRSTEDLMAKMGELRQRQEGYLD